MPREPKWDRVLTSAARLFAEDGFAATSVRAVAERARLTKAGLYYHIKEKEDLLYRINVVEIAVPPLRDRLEDLTALVRHFTTLLARGAGVAARTFDPEAVARLQRHAWPGNVRELRNVVERALILAPGRTVSVSTSAASRETPLPRSVSSGSTGVAPSGIRATAGGGR